jgi:glycosyltransferase involved in cell wall biosynthesis
MDYDVQVVAIMDSIQGGAATGSLRTLREVRQRMDDLKIWHFSQPNIDDSDSIFTLDSRAKRPPFERLLKNISRPAADDLMRRRRTSLLRKALSRSDIDVLNLANIHSSGLTHNSILEVCQQYPIIWTMHDCWVFQPFAFSFPNSRLDKSADYTLPDSDFGRGQEIRHRFFEERPDTILVAPSRWIERYARASLGPDIEIRYVPYGVPSKLFSPIEKSVAKQILNLDDQKIWLGLSSTWANLRKGNDLLAGALKLLNSKGIGCLVWGGALGPEFQGLPNLRHVGNVFDEKISALLYSACDLFVCPSRADNLPNACLEALACGTPLIGSDAGGIPEMARSGSTGWVFNSDSVESLKDSLEQAFGERSMWETYGANSQDLVAREFNVQATALAYSSIFTRAKRIT